MVHWSLLLAGDSVLREGTDTHLFHQRFLIIVRLSLKHGGMHRIPKYCRIAPETILTRSSHSILLLLVTE